MSQTARAMVLDLGSGLRAAVSRDEMVQLVTAVPVRAVPRTPPHCRHALVWMERAVPLMDLRAFLLRTAPEQQLTVPMAAIVAWQPAPREPAHYTALRIETPPQIVAVGDDQACELPEDNPLWGDLAHACFAPHDGGRVPILDLTHIFSGALGGARRSDPPQPAEAMG